MYNLQGIYGNSRGKLYAIHKEPRTRAPRFIQANTKSPTGSSTHSLAKIDREIDREIDIGRTGLEQSRIGGTEEQSRTELEQRISRGAT